ncbi:MAG: lysylphosphatidylglycerol synthase transmembrane domain-containing protein [Chlamydiota bacterium]
MSKGTRAVVGIALALLCLAVAFRGVDFRELWSALTQADYLWLIPAMVVVSVSMIFRVFRWQCLLRPMKRIGFWDLFSAISICFMANNVLPARSGEFIRAMLVGKKHGVSVSTVLATVVLERISDALCVMALFLFLIFSLTVSPEMKRLGLVLVAGYLGILALLVAARIYPAAVEGAAHRLLVRISPRIALRVRAAVASFVQGLSVLKDGSQVALIVVYSVFVWGGILVTYYFINRAFGVRGLGLSGYTLLLSMLALAVMVPSPGYMGSFQLGYKKALTVFGHAANTALACGWVAWGSQYIFINLVGVICLWREGVTFGALKREEGKVEDEIGRRGPSDAGR